MSIAAFAKHSLDGQYRSSPARTPFDIRDGAIANRDDRVRVILC